MFRKFVLPSVHAAEFQMNINLGQFGYAVNIPPYRSSIGDIRGSYAEFASTRLFPCSYFPLVSNL